METKLTDRKSKICSPRGDEHKIPLPEFLQRLGVDDSGLRNDENIISNISVTDMFLRVIWGNGIIEPFPK